MYEQYFRLGELPFRLNADPRFLYLSPSHARARACLDWAIEQRDGLVVITGHPGCGKSMLVADLSARIRDSARLVVLDQSQLDATELLETLALRLADGPGKLRAPAPGTGRPRLRRWLHHALRTHLEAGDPVTLVVDEAQLLGAEALEELRLLADQQHAGSRLLAVILVGQRCLEAKLARAGLEHLNQRVRLTYSLEPLGLHDTRRYIRHRLSVAGEDNCVGVNERALALVHRYTGGVPRLVNVLMDLALTAAALAGHNGVTDTTVKEALAELGWDPYSMRRLKSALRRLRQRIAAGFARAAHGIDGPRRPTVTKAGNAQASRVARARAARNERAAADAHARPAATAAPVWRDRPSLALGGAVLALAVSAAMVRLTPPPHTASADAPKRGPAAAAQARSPVSTGLTDRVTGLPVPIRVVTDFAPASAGVHTPVMVIDGAVIDGLVPVASASAPGADSTAAGVPSDEPPEHHLPLPAGLRGERWLLSLAPDRYAVQVFATADAEGVERFAQEYERLAPPPDGSALAAYTTSRNGSAWHVVVMGSWDGFESARAAAEALPSPIRRGGPWVRRVDAMQAAIRQRPAGVSTLVPPEDYATAFVTPQE